MIATALRTLFAVMRKELVQAFRDKRMVVLLLAAPVIELVVFGFAVDLQVDHIPTIVCDQDDTEASRALVRQFVAGGTFVEEARETDPRTALDGVVDGRASAVLIVPRGYSRAGGRRASVQAQVLVDGADTNLAQVAIGAAPVLLEMPGRTSEGGGIAVVPRVLFNPRLSSPVYMLPGVASSLLLNVTAIIMAMGIAREKEAGTLEQVLVTPLSPTILLAGKCLPFVFMGMLDLVAVLVLGNAIFGLPIRGGLAVVATGAALYLLSTLGIGILLATFSKSQQQAILSAFAFMLPALLLSGFMTPVSSMPRWIQPVTLADPMRHFLEILRASLLKGAGFRELAPQLSALGAIGAVIFTSAILRFRKQGL